MVAQTVKSLPAMQETWVQSLGQEDPLRREWLPTPIFLPEEFHGQRSLAGCSPWGRKRVRHDLAIKKQQATLFFMDPNINLAYIS